jgi:hypothetical protein
MADRLDYRSSSPSGLEEWLLDWPEPDAQYSAIPPTNSIAMRRF